MFSSVHVTQSRATIVVALLLVAALGREAGAETFMVNAGGDLQAAIDAARCGDTIVVQSGATFSRPQHESFWLRNKGACTGTDADWITIRPSNLAGIASDGSRINPSVHAAAMPKLVGTGSQWVIRTEPYAHHYRLIGFEVTTSGATNHYTADLIDVVTLGNGPGGYSTRAEKLGTHHIVFDRFFVHPAEISGSQLRATVDYRTSGRGFALAGMNISVVNSDIRGFGGYYYGTTSVVDAYGIYMPTAPADRILIHNNYIQAHTMNVFSGGGGGESPNSATVSSGSTTQATLSNVNNLRVGDYIVLRVGNTGAREDFGVARVNSISGNTVTYTGVGPNALTRTPLSPGYAAWNGDNITNLEVSHNTIDKINQAGGRKGWFELKSVDGAMIYGNRFQGEWASDVALTVRNQDGRTPWAVTKNVTFRSNVMSNYSRFITLLLEDDEMTSTPGTNILVENNLGLGSTNDDHSHTIFIAGGSGVTIRHNTVIEPVATNSALFGAGPTANTTVRDNIISHGAYGFSCLYPPYTLAACWNPFSKDHNVLINTSGESDGNLASANPNDRIASNANSVGFVNMSAGDYKLSSSSPFRLGASDGKDPGVDWDALMAAQAGAGHSGGTNPSPPQAPTNLRIVQ